MVIQKSRFIIVFIVVDVVHFLQTLKFPIYNQFIFLSIDRRFERKLSDAIISSVNISRFVKGILV